ncbi:MAG: ABC transporter substrate-binding protein [Bacillota bacterium]
MTRWKLWAGAVLVTLLLSATTVGAEKATLTVWHPFGPSGHPGGGDLFNKLVSEFEASHPNVKIQATLYGVLELRQKMQVALPAGTEPDIWFGGPAAATLGRFAQAGYLADLTPYYEKYGWKSVTEEQGLKYVSYKGRYYGVPHNPDVVVIYYNKDMFKASGWQVPNTYTEFVALIKAIRTKGLPPILFGDRDGWPGVNPGSPLTGLDRRVLGW